MCFGGHLLQMTKVSIEIVIDVQKCPKIQNKDEPLKVHTNNLSLGCFFVAGRSQYNPNVCFWDHFALISRNVFKTLIAVQKLTESVTQSTAIGST
jgi:hypothetical protein